MRASVIICSYNPNLSVLMKVLSSIKAQTVDETLFETILIDNNTPGGIKIPASAEVPGNFRVVTEPVPGLAYARLAGIREAKSDLIIFADDDNVLSSVYIEESLKIAAQYNYLGAWGGKAIPVFAATAEEWLDEFWGLIGCRDLGAEIKTTGYYKESLAPKIIKQYPDFAPIGTGMVIRKKAFLDYQQDIMNDRARMNLGRRGKELTSGEDNDIVLSLLKKGWDIGYFPDLLVKHIIPASRITKAYLGKMNHAQSKSWVQVLNFHSIQIWKPIPAFTVPFRKIKAFFTCKAWVSPSNYIKWRGACGMFDGLATIHI